MPEVFRPWMVTLELKALEFQTERLNQVRRIADIAVIGSAIIEIINDSEAADLENNLSAFLRSIIDD